MVVNKGKNAPSAYDDTYKPDFMRHIMGDRDRTEASSFDSSTIKPAKVSNVTGGYVPEIPVESRSSARIVHSGVDKEAAEKNIATEPEQLSERLVPYSSDSKKGPNPDDVDDLKRILAELEVNMEREIQATKAKYEIKKAPIIEAILAKGGVVPHSAKTARYGAV
ncbi:hypothetical protein HDU96_010654 [Phlyctochytrium bullatum]|nr:hypothetical protein HDU96_010654 [Phlyctochytrium bullatum]